MGTNGNGRKRLDLDAMVSGVAGEIKLGGEWRAVRHLDGPHYYAVRHMEPATTEETFYRAAAFALAPALTEDEARRMLRPEQAVAVVNMACATIEDVERHLGDPPPEQPDPNAEPGAGPEQSPPPQP